MRKKRTLDRIPLSRKNTFPSLFNVAFNRRPRDGTNSRAIRGDFIRGISAERERERKMGFLHGQVDARRVRADLVVRAKGRGSIMMEHSQLLFADERDHYACSSRLFQGVAIAREIQARGLYRASSFIPADLRVSLVAKPRTMIQRGVRQDAGDRRAIRYRVQRGRAKRA